MSTAPDCIEYTPGWMSPENASRAYEALLASLPWQEIPLVVYGRRCIAPRLMAWYGAHDYAFSGGRTPAHPLAGNPVVDSLRIAVEQTTNSAYNSCLANLYRSGTDTVGWHSDDEPGLGTEPVIASLSLGGERDFQLREKTTKETWTWSLRSGDLVVMRGPSQRDFAHQIPRRAKQNAPRINLTFRFYDLATSGG